MEKTKYIILVLVLIILLIGYCVIRKNKTEKVTDKKKPKKTKKNIKHKTSNKKNSPREEEEEEEEEEENDAQELYNLVHEKLARGMNEEEFKEIVGDIADSLVYIELKQLYNECVEENKNPLKCVTVKDYEKILNKSD